MGFIVKNGVSYGGGSIEAELQAYDNTNSGLNATNVQDAIDELNSLVARLMLLYKGDEPNN